MQNLLQQNRATLDIARQGLEDMVPSYPAYKDEVLESVASELASDDSVLGDRDSVISHTRFPFDDICFGTKAYQRAVARVSSKKAHQPKKKGSMPDRDSYLPSAGDSETETESEPSSEKATITAPAVVESAVHEAVCLRLQEAEARIRALEAKIQQEATEKIGDQSPGVSLKNEVLQEQLLLSELVREVSSTSEAMDYAKVGAIDEHAGAHEDGENNDKPSNLQSERYDHHDKSDIPFPLRYVPYQPERRGLSPVPEVPEYTAGHTRHTKAALDSLTHTIDSSGLAKAKQIANDSGRGDRSRRRPTIQDDDGEGKRITDNGGPFLASMVGKDHDGSASGSAEPVIKPNSTHKITRSQTSLLIEYFESGKGKASGDVRKPSVRVRLTPTPKRQTGLHQQGIAVTKRQPLHGDGDRHHLPSEISAIPPDTFLDGSGTGRSKHSLDPTAPKIRDRLAADGRLKPKEPRARKSRSRSSSLTESAQRAQGRTRTSHARATSLAEREVPLVAPNPKLLETVEDAIKRLILPELDAVKRRQKKRMEPEVAKCEDQLDAQRQ